MFQFRVSQAFVSSFYCIVDAAMKFGDTFRSAILKEWRSYAVDYEALNDEVNKDRLGGKEKVHILLRENVGTLCAFMQDNVSWATNRLPAMQNEISRLEPQLKTNAEKSKDGSYNLIQDFLCLKMKIFSFQKELHLLLDFLDLNKAAVRRILEKIDQAIDFETILSANPVLKGCALVDLKEASDSLWQRAQSYWSLFQDEWKDKIILTGGCFDLFHRGHQNLLEFLQKLGGKRLVATVVGDENYFRQKQKLPIDNYESRKANVAPFVDEVNLLSGSSTVQSKNFIDSWLCFFEKEGVEASDCVVLTSDEHADSCREIYDTISLPFFLLPRTERCSSTLIRATFHNKKTLDPDATTTL